MGKPRAVALAGIGFLATWLSVGCGLEPDPLPPPLPPGQPLAYVSSGLGNADDIFVLSANAQSDRNLTNFAAYDSWPAWSPDGNRIAFVSDRDSAGFDIYLMNTDGGSVKRLTTDAEKPEARGRGGPLGVRCRTS